MALCRRMFLRYRPVALPERRHGSVAAFASNGHSIRGTFEERECECLPVRSKSIAVTHHLVPTFIHRGFPRPSHRVDRRFSEQSSVRR